VVFVKGVLHARGLYIHDILYVSSTLLAVSRGLADFALR
jgi:hypothetical protein